MTRTCLRWSLIFLLGGLAVGAATAAAPPRLVTTQQRLTAVLSDCFASHGKNLLAPASLHGYDLESGPSESTLKW